MTDPDVVRTTITLSLYGDGTWAGTRLDHAPGWAQGDFTRVDDQPTAEAALAALQEDRSQ